MLLQPPRAELERRLAARRAQGTHFMAPSLLDSQLEALEVQLHGFVDSVGTTAGG